ncbi:unnamed protein product [Zymoseptoria tritici ST99CH_1A5]|uniref:Uncharacterized protein n=1 Tax=Zymoseptoria tritici ST99CH_1A5 TaxID=1276529 RepID=A0A1Y6LYD2_ZYMTR|nr:unnamed protein product [Zymoseptoria tritici ST99CH_1A5]
MTPTNRLVVGQTVTNELLKAIDAQLGHLNDRATQDAFLQSYIQHHHPQRVDRNFKLVPHTFDTIRLTLSSAVSKNHIKNGNWIRVWTQGSAMMKRTYLDKIRSRDAPAVVESEDELVTPAQTSSSETVQPAVKAQTTRVKVTSSHSGSAGGITSQQVEKNAEARSRNSSGRRLFLKMPRKPGVDEVSVQAGETDGLGEGPSKKPRQTEGGEVIDLTLTKDGPQPYRKRAAAELETNGEDADDGGGGPSKKAKSLDQSITPFKGDGEKTLSSTSANTPVMQQPPTEKSQGKKAVYPSDRSDTRPPWSMYEMDGSGRVERGVEDPRADLMKFSTEDFERIRSLEHIRNQLWPAGQVDQGRTVYRQNERTLVQGSVRSRMKKMSTRCKDLGYEWTRRNGLNPMARTSFVEKPSQELEKLYRQFLGAKSWKRTLLERENCTTPWIFVDDQVLQSLIAGFIYTEVFTKPAPWDISERLNAASGADLKYGVSAMADKGYHLDELFKKWSEKMILDEKFQQDFVKPHAHDLATQLALVLTPHLMKAKRIQMPEDADAAAESDDGEDNPNTIAYDTKWVDEIEDLVYDSLMLKETIGTYHEVSYEYTWGVPGGQLDRDTMDPVHGKLGFENEVHFTVWPGVRMIPDHRYAGGVAAQTVMTLVQARRWPEHRPLPSTDQQESPL